MLIYELKVDAIMWSTCILLYYTKNNNKEENIQYMDNIHFSDLEAPFIANTAMSDAKLLLNLWK